MMTARLAVAVRLAAAAIAASSLLGGCAIGPTPPTTPRVSLPAAYEPAPSAASAPANIDHWWSLYDDPQLQALVDEALRRAPDALSAKARLAEAVAARSQALSDYAPTGGLQGSASYLSTTALAGPAPVTIPNFGTISLTNSGNSTDYGANFNVSWELDLFGRRFAARKKANGDLAAALFDFEAARASLAANVADQLFQARGLSLQLDDARRTAAIDRQLLEVVREKDRNGVSAGPDVDQASSEAAQAEARAADLDVQLRAARRTLLVLLGRGGDPLDSLQVGSWTQPPPPVPASLPGALLARRPDVREAAARIASAAGTLKLDELALFPKFTLQPGIGVDSALSLGLPLTTASWTAGVGVYQPVFEIPRLRAEIRAQNARAEQAVIAYEKAVQTAYGEASNALAELRSDQARLALLTLAETQARSAFASAQARYAAGLDDLTTLLGAERTWRSARTGLTSAQIEASRRSVQVFKALGGGWDSSSAPTAAPR
jgi:NodT family efflux transporter outer membrane factor (OMF) lipoprotein